MHQRAQDVSTNEPKQDPDELCMDERESPYRQRADRWCQRHGQVSEKPCGRHEGHRPIAQPSRYQDGKNHCVEKHVEESSRKPHGSFGLPHGGVGEDAPAKPKDDDGKDRHADRHVERKPVHRRHTRPVHRSKGNGDLRRERDHSQPMQQTNAEMPVQARILSHL